MLNKGLKWMAALAMLLFIVACSDGKLEKRIANLESRVASLENGGTASATSQSNPRNVNNPSVTSVEDPPVPEGPLAKIEFTKTNHDFGDIPEGQTAEHVFTFTNTGETPLIISDAKGSCGCTVPDWPKEPIAVGESGEIKVRFNSNNRPGVNNKNVRVTANTDPTVTTLRIKSNVVAKNTSASNDGPVRQ